MENTTRTAADVDERFTFLRRMLENGLDPAVDDSILIGTVSKMCSDLVFRKELGMDLLDPQEVMEIGHRMSRELKVLVELAFDHPELQDDLMVELSLRYNTLQSSAHMYLSALTAMYGPLLHLMFKSASLMECKRLAEDLYDYSHQINHLLDGMNELVLNPSRNADDKEDLDQGFKIVG